MSPRFRKIHELIGELILLGIAIHGAHMFLTWLFMQGH